MSISELKGKNVNIKLWAPLNEVESSALDQLRNVAALPWVAHIAVMPDVHAGVGATVGSVIALKGAVSPATVGVDIGCGMGAIRTNLTADDLPNNLKRLRTRIEELIPVGFNSNKSPVKLNEYQVSVLNKEMNGLSVDSFDTLFSTFKDLDPGIIDLAAISMNQVGTLGSGNHFIELCLDKSPKPRVWMMLHSGSRKIGQALANIHIARAMELTHNKGLPDKNLAVFLSGTPEMKAYRHDLFWAQRYAFLNRATMFETYKGVMKEFFKNVEFETPILCHHNFVAEELHFGNNLMVTRKGAINAERGRMGVIPGSMGTHSYIVRGLGNPESLNSASHGAGRRMSRGQAKKKFTLDDLVEQTKGVECRKDESVLDEIPGCYKNIEKVMENQKDLVEIVEELSQVLCVKG